MEIIAHRGASHDAPENTLAAIRLAWLHGADAVEVDVHLTADGRLAVIHDLDTSRTGRAGGVVFAINSSKLTELQRVDVGGWKGAQFIGERIAALDDALALVPPGKRIFVEVKSGPAALDELVRCLTRCPLTPAQVVVISFDFDVARHAKRRLPRCEVCWIIERESVDGRRPRPEIMRAATDAGLDGLDLEADWVDESWVQQSGTAGFKLYDWTVDDAALGQRLARLGVDGITTNRPQWLREQLRD